MAGEQESGRRDFVKVSVDIPIRFKFLSKTLQLTDTGVHEGVTSNLSGMGLVVTTRLPSAELLAPLLTHEVLIGVNIFLPSLENPIKALTSVSWIEAVTEGTGKTSIGLRFTDIKKEDQDEILRYVIKSQITRKIQR